MSYERPMLPLIEDGRTACLRRRSRRRRGACTAQSPTGRTIRASSTLSCGELCPASRTNFTVSSTAATEAWRRLCAISSPTVGRCGCTRPQPLEYV